MCASSWAITASSCSGDSPPSTAVGTSNTGRSQPTTTGTCRRVDSSNRTVRVNPRRAASASFTSSQCAETGRVPRRSSRRACHQPPARRTEQSNTPTAQAITTQGNTRLASMTTRWSSPAERPIGVVASPVGVTLADGESSRAAACTSSKYGEAGSRGSASCQIVKVGASSIRASVTQPATYRARAKPRGNTSNVSPSSAASSVPCQRKWIRPQPTTSDTRSRRADRFVIACLRRVRRAGGGSRPGRSRRSCGPTTRASPAAWPNHRMRGP